MLITSNKLFEQLKEFEGLRLEAYQDAGGVLTIGYGHTYHVRRGDRISAYWAEEMLRKDVAMFEREVLALGVARTQSQFDALVSFAFNIGIDRLRTSTLLRRIKEYNVCEPRLREVFENLVTREFLRWHYCGGRVLPGLDRRRRWEASRFLEEKPYDAACCAEFDLLVKELRRARHEQQ